MKKYRFSLTPVISLLLLVTLVIITYFSQQQKNNFLNDHTNKLTLLHTAQKIPGLKNIIQQNLAKQEAQAIQQTRSENVIDRERSYTEEEIKQMTEESFVTLLQETSARLPKVSDIKKLPPGALHHTPPMILQAGRRLGLIKEILKIHESYERMATPFYHKCALDSEGTTPVRALCLTNFMEIKNRNGENIDTKEFPKHIVELAKMVIGQK